jgi:hypothetical protein
MRVALCILGLIFPLSEIHALTCRGDADPYQQITALYERSEFVFIATPIVDPMTGRAHSAQVESVWKGPDLDQVQIQLFAQGTTPRLIFAARPSTGLGWYRVRPDCIFLPHGETIEAVVRRQFGTPQPPSGGELIPIEVIYIGVLLIALGGVSYLTWSIRDA